MKRHLILYIILGLLTSLSAFAQKNNKTAPKANEKQAFTVVIDAGHGGHDPGAVGKIVQEKKLNLDVALRVGQLIETGFPEVKVVYTRKTDVYLTLQQRADIVNKNKADLFICIHTNAVDNRGVSGAETFVLGIDKMQSNLDVAMRENSVMLMESDYQTAYEGFDPNSVESYIMFELMQDQYIDQSLQFATLVQQQFSGTLQRADRGVRQAGFWVLHKSACPSALIELGFVSNAEEEKYLSSDKGKQEMSEAIYTAFSDYKTAIDRRSANANKVTATAEKKAESTKKTEPAKKAEPAKQAEPAKKAEPAKQAEPAKKAEPAKQAEPAKKAEPAKQVEPAKKTEPAKPEVPAAAVERPVYRVQIFATTKQLPEGDPTFRGLKNCKFTKDGNYYKYTYGEDVDYETIVEIRDQLKSKFKDCFIVAFYKGHQIFVKDARAMKF